MTRTKPIRCSDGLCGAVDCPRCFPTTWYWEDCPTCDGTGRIDVREKR